MGVLPFFAECLGAACNLIPGQSHTLCIEGIYLNNKMF